MKNLHYIIVLFLSVYLFSNCNKNDDMKKDNTCPDCPVIESIDPKFGQPGRPMIITGDNFTGLSKVLFNTTEAEIIPETASDTEVEVIVPDLGSNKEASIMIERIFKTPSGSDQSLRSAQDVVFTYIKGEPSLDLITPNRGPAGVIVSIEGQRLSDISKVFFDDEEAVILNRSGTEIMTITPQIDALGIIDVHIISKIAIDGDSVDIESNRLKYEYIEGHEVIDFNPKSGKMNTEVTISGRNFGVQSEMIVRFNDVIASIMSVTENEIVAIVPKGAGDGRISLEKGGIVVQSEADFRYENTYTVSDFFLLGYEPWEIDYHNGKLFVSEIRLSNPKYSIFYDEIHEITTTYINGGISGGGFDKDRNYYVGSLDGVFKMPSNSFTFSSSPQSITPTYCNDISFGIDHLSSGEQTKMFASLELAELKLAIFELNGKVNTEILTSGAPTGEGSIPRSGTASKIFLENYYTLYFTSQHTFKKYYKTRAGTGDALIKKVAGNGTKGYKDGNLNEARFNKLSGIASRKVGVYYVSDSDNNCVRKIDLINNLVTTIAGATSAGDINGDGASARFNDPRGLCFDGEGNLLIADSNNKKLRKITIQ